MRRPAVYALLLVAFPLAACRQDMDAQPKLQTNGAAPGLWESADRPVPTGTVARSDLERDRQTSAPPPVDAAFIARGRERYGIYCAPCHGLAGDGDGMIPQRGFPAPPSYHTPGLLAAKADYIFDVITNGEGVMYPYRNRIAPRDRWAIVAYIRALQLSRRPQLAAKAASSTGAAP